MRCHSRWSRQTPAESLMRGLKGLPQSSITDGFAFEDRLQIAALKPEGDKDAETRRTGGLTSRR